MSPKTPSLKGAALASYTQLRDKVKETLLEGQQKIERQKVLTYWETGKLIKEHLLSNKDRADFGRFVIRKLAEDLEVDETNLWKMLQFARAFPILDARLELTWAHYRVAAQIPDEKKREQLVARAAQKEWTSRELEFEVRKITARIREAKTSILPGKTKQPAVQLLTPQKGAPYTYRLVKHEKVHAGKTDLRIDLGFSCYKEAAMRGADKFKAGDIVESKWIKDDLYSLHSSRSAESGLFTFYAYIERVIDGDTLFAQVDLGFGEWTRQYLRLRGIDCPELYTSAGKKAKKFVEDALGGVPYVTITSSKSDKYDRYLADVYYENKHGEQFLNNRLLEARLAERV